MRCRHLFSMRFRHLQGRNIDVPVDFPGNYFDAIEARVQSKFPGNRHLPYFLGAWSAVLYRFLALAEYDEEFTRQFRRFGASPVPQKRYEQERDLFGFFASGCSAVDAFFFSLFAIGAMLAPTTFPLNNEQDERKVKLDGCYRKYCIAFAGDPILTALQVVMTPGDPEWADFCNCRNILTHRAAPHRVFQIGDATSPAAVMARTDIVLDENTTSSRRTDIVFLLERLLAAGNVFVQTHMP
jgi:hypothetical protein